MMKLLAATLLLAASGAIAQDDSKYRVEQEPRRVALVMSNDAYMHLGPVQSATRDAETIESQLRTMGFNVTRLRSVTSVRDFEDIALPQFRSQLQDGDIVVVYFSGHGFAYGQHNYLASANQQLRLEEAQIPDQAISVEGLETYLVKRRPGLLLIIVDACRDMPGFVITNRDKDTSDTVEKGFASHPANNIGTNTIVAYGARLGYSALGSTNPDQLSTFTRSLVAHLAKQGVEFGDSFNDASTEVKVESNDKQQPGMQDWSDTNLYFIPDDVIRQRERDAWNAALATADRRHIKRYSYRFSTSRHAAAARQWLQDNPISPLSYTLVSPAAAELTWTASSDSAGIRRVDMGVAFDRVARLTDPRDGLSGLSASLTRASRKVQKRQSTELARVAAMFGSYTSMVARPNIAAKSTPSAAAHVVNVPVGARLTFVGVTREDERNWMVASSGSRELFVEIPDKELAPLSIGHPLQEVLVPPSTLGIQDLVDSRAITATLKALKEQGRTVTWVSVAFGLADDFQVTEEREARSIHAVYLLKMEGIDGTRITTVGIPGSDLGGHVRLRFFGY